MADSNPTNLKSPKAKRAPRSPQMVVVVPQEIIDTAERSNSHTCMIADAISAMLPYTTKVTVDAATIRWTNPDKGVRYVFVTPIKVRTEIVQFDKGEHVEEFSFHLRGAWVTRTQRRDGGKKRIKQADWQNVKEKIKEIRSKRGIDWATVANEMEVSAGTLKSRLSDNDIPTTVNANKMEKWVLKQTGEKPAPRIKSHADQASGPVRMRSEKSTKRIDPELIGGNPPPPVSTSWRQFGLRMFQEK
jgi:hypothetical protein